MAKYRVLKPIEWGATQASVKMYFPVDYWGVDKAKKTPLPCPYKVVPSGCNGRDIPVDISGIIELPDSIAAELNLGQIESLDGEPHREGYEVLGRALSAEQEKRGMEDKVEVGGKDEWKVGAPRQVTPVSTDGTLRVG